MAKGGGKPKGKTQPNIDWKRVRERWEANPTLSFRQLSDEFGGTPSKQAIGQRHKREGWTRVDATEPSVAEAVNKAADAKSVKSAKAVVGEVLAPEPPPAPPGQPSPGALSEAIEIRAKVIDRHRKELNYARQKVYAGLQGGDFEKLKQGKIAAEALAIIQTSERKAWGLDGTPTLNVRVIAQGGRDNND